MHPIVPPCPSAEEYRSNAEEYRDRAKALQDKLDMVYLALEEAESDLDHLYDFLENCDCCLREYLETSSGVRRRSRRSRMDDDDDDEAISTAGSRRKHEHVRGAAQADKDREARHGVRTGRRWGSERGRSGSEF